MKNKIITIILVLALLAGVGLLLYPVVSNVLHDRKKDTILTEYNEGIANLSESSQDKIRAEAEKYNRKLMGTVIISDPFDPDYADDMDESYVSALNPDGTGIMAYIEIPRIKVYEPVYHGTSEETLAKGAGHLANTSLPVGGMGTHAVITGHTGLPDAEMFNKLDTLKEDDIFYIHVLGETLAYQVDQMKVVEPSDVSDLYINAEKDYVTLITCTPYGVNSHRLLVRGTRVSYTKEVQEIAAAQQSEGAGTENWKKIYGVAIAKGIGLAVVILLIVIVIDRCVKQKKTKK